MNTHTPGPWLADSVHRCSTPDGMISFRIRANDGKSICAASSNGKRDPLEIAANARLIAAAPDLLKVAQTVATLTTAGVSIGHCMRIASAAIAKAEGRT